VTIAHDFFSYGGARLPSRACPETTLPRDADGRRGAVLRREAYLSFAALTSSGVQGVVRVDVAARTAATCSAVTVFGSNFTGAGVPAGFAGVAVGDGDGDGAGSVWPIAAELHTSANRATVRNDLKRKSTKNSPRNIGL